MPILLGEWPSNLKHDFHKIPSNDTLISNGHQAVQLVMPTIVGGQHAVMPVAQLGNLGQVAIMSPSQVVVQQRNEFYLLFYCFPTHRCVCYIWDWILGLYYTTWRWLYLSIEPANYILIFHDELDMSGSLCVLWLSKTQIKWLEHMWHNSRRLSAAAINRTDEARTESNCDN